MFMRSYQPYIDPAWPALDNAWPEVEEREEFDAWLDEMVTKKIKEEENENDHTN